MASTTARSMNSTRASRETAVNVPLEERTTRPVPCRPCVAAMMMVHTPANRKADNCRGSRVSCTDKRKSCLSLLFPIQIFLRLGKPRWQN